MKELHSEEGRKKESSVFWFKIQIPATVEIEPEWGQEPETPSRWISHVGGRGVSTWSSSVAFLGRSTGSWTGTGVAGIQTSSDMGFQQCRCHFSPRTFIFYLNQVLAPDLSFLTFYFNHSALALWQLYSVSKLSWDPDIPFSNFPDLLSFFFFRRLQLHMLDRLLLSSGL